MSRPIPLPAARSLLARTLSRATLLPAVLLGVGAAPALAQTAIVSGRVISEFGRPLDAADVFITELGISVRTTADGRYSIAIPSLRIRGQPAVLRVRSIGYVAQGKQINISEGAQTHDFALRRDVNRLDEIVVTGTVTGTAQKKLAFSVARLDEADMPVPAVNALQQLQGKVPGAHIVQPSGRPGSAPAIVLRGPKSINATGRSQEPLLIVDGVILNSGLQELNPQDIESLEVVKGAAASSLYGSRAGAGVIQIKTRSGLRGPQGTRFTVRSEYGFKDVQNEYRYSTRHFLMMDEQNERFCIKVSNQPPCSRTVDFEEETRRINDTTFSTALQPHAFERDIGIATPASKPELKGLFQLNHWPRRYNPIAQMVTNGQFLNNVVDVSGRSGGIAYFVSSSNLAEQGAMRYLRGYRRSSARANLDLSVASQWQIALSSTFATSTQFPSVSGGPGLIDQEDFFRATRVPPSVNLLRRDRFGRLFIRSNPLAHGGQNSNPLYDFENSQGQLDVDRLIASLQIRYAPNDWLSLSATGSADRRHTAAEVFRDRGYRSTGLQFWRDGIIDLEKGAQLSHNVLLTGSAKFAPGRDWNGTITTTYSYEQDDATSSFGHGEVLAVPGVRTLANATSNILVRSDQRSVRAIGAVAGAQLEYKERYILDGLVRYDGSSLFGAKERWHPYSRGSVAWRIADEPFWPIRNVANDVKLRASVGTAGGRPNFLAQYETFSVGAGGLVTARTLGNERLKPEHTLETELGVDAELFNKYGLSLTFARDITTNQLLLVPAPAASGYPEQWRNAGTLDGRTWELALRIPLVTGRAFVWNSQLTWDQNRTYVTALDAPPFFSSVVHRSGQGVRFYIAPGERYGTIYGRKFATRCSELPAPFDAQCGPGREWQANDEGYIVWIGAGHTWRDGIALNLWQAVRPGCVKDGVALNAVGVVECERRGGTVNAPWGVPETHWGMPILLRDSAAAPLNLPLGNTLPAFRATMSHTVQWKRLKLYGLLDMSVGNRVFNLERQWSLGDFMVRDQDQDGKTPETAKPVGYYWRAPPPESQGVGGFYDVALATNRTVEDGSYTKLREVSITYDLGRFAGWGEWSVSLLGRNLYTWARYTGYDPEVGTGGGITNSAALATGGMFQYPPTRAFTMALMVSF